MARTFPQPATEAAREPLEPGELVRWLYRLGRSGATGVLTLEHAGCPAHELLVIRRGYLMAAEVDPSGRRAARRLARLAAIEGARARFDGGTAIYPPGATRRQFRLTSWARAHLERQLDTSRATELVRELAGARVRVVGGERPDDELCDDIDRRILDVMRVPRRLDQIWPLARTPRFRLLTFLHFLRAVGALEIEGVAAPRIEPPAACPSAHELLGLSPSADAIAVKRAYRRLARALHPDLHPGASSRRRRALERKLAEVTTAYRALTAAGSR